MLSVFDQSLSAAVLNIAVLVFREGLECILVVSAVTAGLKGTDLIYRRSIALGVGAGVAATWITWRVAVRILDDLGQNVSALKVQAATGLLAIIVLLVVMNWFFHKIYWTGWISMHNERKRNLLSSVGGDERTPRIRFGMALLGFTSFYREGVEVVLFLQSYRLRLGNAVVSNGAILGTFAFVAIAVLTFVGHRHLPYRRMLVTTGLMLAVVLLVMVGEEAQEMQLARWLPTTEIPGLARAIPSWMSIWFSVFPTIEALSAQAIAAVLVFGSYLTARSATR